MKTPKLSVIIPVYGVEKYIGRCARSLFEQTLDDIEFVFVDDCTPDRSMEILSQIIEEYRLRFAEKNYVVRTEKMPTNSGLPAVRRHGIQLCTGDYITHCDSDDWLESDAYERCYRLLIAQNLDMVFYDFDWTDGDKLNRYIRRNPQVHSSKNLLSQLISGKLMGSVWGVVTRREVYRGVLYYPNANVTEDLVLMIQLVNSANTFGYINHPLYNYFINSDSITAKTTSSKALSNYKQAWQNSLLIIKYLQKTNLIDKFQKELVAFISLKMNYLSPFTGDNEIRKIWNERFKDIGWSFLFNKYVRNDIKLTFVLVKLHLFSYIYNYRHR